MKTRKPIKRSGKPIARRNAARKTRPLRGRQGRSKTEYARIYGSKGRVLFVKGLQCAACHVSGYSENAHVPPVGKAGMGYKAGYLFIAPLCGAHEIWENMDDWYIGCHTMYDEHYEKFTARFPDFDAAKACADCEAAWLLEESA